MARKRTETTSRLIADGKKWEVVAGDAKEACKAFPPDYFDAVLCDPPYGISFMGKGWDSDVPSPELWAEVLRVLKPGAPCIAFSGTRTYHRTTWAIERAGFEVADMFTWHYGQGWPKGLDLSKAIDKALGANRRVTGKVANIGPEWGGKPRSGERREEPATTQAASWQGYNTQLKPACEPACLAFKPKDGSFAENAMKHGVGALNVGDSRVGDSRVGDDGGTKHVATDEMFTSSCFGARRRGNVADIPAGRYPTNVLMSHAPGCRLVGKRPSNDVATKTRSTGEVVSANRAMTGGNYGRIVEDVAKRPDEDVWECEPNCPCALMDAQSGNRPGGGSIRVTSTKTRKVFGTMDGVTPREPMGDDGGASRFYKQFPFPEAPELALYQEAMERFMYCAKASTAERGSENDHSTVKPMKLMEYLARLILPPRPTRILVPFCGSGSEMLGCLLAGWPEVVGIELDPRMAEVARWRVANAKTTSTRTVIGG
jgi:hypothetical protein